MEIRASLGQISVAAACMRSGTPNMPPTAQQIYTNKIVGVDLSRPIGNQVAEDEVSKKLLTSP